MDLPPVPRELTPEERQAVAWVRENGDRFQTYTVKDGKVTVVVDAVQERLVNCNRDERFSLSLFDLDDDDKASLAPGTTEELAN